MTLVRMHRPDLRGMLIRVFRCGVCHAPWQRPPEVGDVCPYCGTAPEPGVAA